MNVAVRILPKEDIAIRAGRLCFARLLPENTCMVLGECLLSAWGSYVLYEKVGYAAVLLCHLFCCDDAELEIIVQ